MGHSTPSSANIRSVLLGLPEGTVKVPVGKWTIPIDGYVAKMGYIYQYLVAGRVIEVFGSYGPQRRHVIELELDGEPALMFAVKTGKRQTKRGWTLRPATVPLNPLYEPLTKILYEYIKTKNPNENLFRLHKNPNTSKRYSQGYISEIFSGYEWSFIPYTRTAYADPSLGFTYDPYTKHRDEITEETYLNNKSKIKWEKTKGWTTISVKVDTRWRHMASHELRKRRLRDLEMPYYFDSTDLNYYAGWESKNDELAKAAKHYLEQDLDESEENKLILANMSKRYFKKLLIPITKLLDPTNSEIGGIKIIG